MEFLVFGGLLFWIAVAIVAALSIIFVEKQKNWSTFITLVLFAVALEWFSNVKPITWVFHHPMKLLVYIGVYAIIGAVWSVIKWWLYTLDARDRYTKSRVEYMQQNNLAEMGEIDVKRFVKLYKLEKFPPMPHNEAMRISVWIAYWPLSGLWTLINDPIRRLFIAIRQSLQGVYTGISNSIFAQYKSDLDALQR